MKCLLSFPHSSSRTPVSRSCMQRANYLDEADTRGHVQKIRWFSKNNVITVTLARADLKWQKGKVGTELSCVQSFPCFRVLISLLILPNDYTLSSLSLSSNFLKAYSKFSISALVISSTCTLYNNHVKNTPDHWWSFYLKLRLSWLGQAIIKRILIWPRNKSKLIAVACEAEALQKIWSARSAREERDARVGAATPSRVPLDLAFHFSLSYTSKIIHSTLRVCTHSCFPS